MILTIRGAQLRKQSEVPASHTIHENEVATRDSLQSPNELGVTWITTSTLATRIAGSITKCTYKLLFSYRENPQNLKRKTEKTSEK